MIPEDYIDNVCKMGQREDTCAYLALGRNGFECAKDSELRLYIEHRLAAGTLRAKGDNCPGWSEVVRTLN